LVYFGLSIEVAAHYVPHVAFEAGPAFKAKIEPRMIGPYIEDVPDFVN